MMALRSSLATAVFVVTAVLVGATGCSTTKTIGSPPVADATTTTFGSTVTEPTSTAPVTTAPPSTEASTTTSSTLPPLEALQVGSRGPLVEELQQALADRGNTIDIDGAFGPATAAVVKSFQEMVGLPADGIAGPVTLAALGLGQYRVGDYPSLDALAADMANYLNTGATGGLPADVVASLAWFVYAAPGPSPFIVLSIDPQSNGLATVTLSGLDQQGNGPVVVMQLCFQADAPFTWCGVLSVGADA